MELSIELFDQIASALGGAAAAECGAGGGAAAAPATPKRDPENRRAARINLAADVQIVPYGVTSARPRTVKLLSLSRAGAAVLDWASMKAGEKIVLHLPREGGATVPIVCMVCNTRLSGGQFRLGVQFLSTAENTGPGMVRGVDGLVGRAASSGDVDVIEQLALNGIDPARASREHRVNLNMQALMSPFENGVAGPMHVVTVRDISPGGGVCILEHEEMERGRQFVLQVPRRAGKALTMLCTVMDCRRMDDAQFRIGAKFETKVTQTTGPTDDDGRRRQRGVFARVRRWFAA
jgi:hypothetical protein